MSKKNTKIAPDSSMSFYDKAAWYLLAALFVTIGLGWMVLLALHRSSLSLLEMENIERAVIASALFFEFVCFILGLSIYCRPKMHKRKVTVWLSLASILASCGLGFLTLVILTFSNMGHGC